MSGYAWGVIGVTAAFIAETGWWLSQDRSIPIFDAGAYLTQAVVFHRWLSVGHLLKPFTFISPHPPAHPPLAPLVGASATFVGGVNVASPIVGQNLVFVPLLTLGCYQTGRLLIGERAGLLAALFALGSPLLIAQSHVFMLDTPETALVAVSMWLILAADAFTRTRIAAWAGLAVGCGLLIKQTFPFYISGILLVALARGGWRHWRGLAAFTGMAVAIGAPWYLYHLTAFNNMTNLTPGNGTAANAPPTFSVFKWTWYFRSALNSLLYAPLFILALVGAIWMTAAVVRGGVDKGPGIEFLVGALVAWLAITLTPLHDTRYELPMLPYLAVMGTGWITKASRRDVRVAAICVLALATAANTLGTTFGVGPRVRTALGNSLPYFPDRIVWYSNTGYLVGAPQRDGDVPGLLRALRRDGVQTLTFANVAAVDPTTPGRFLTTARAQAGQPDFSTSGLKALALMAQLATSPQRTLIRKHPNAVALLHAPIASGAPPPCTKLSDGTGVWIVRLNPAAPRLSLYCPYPHPHFYL